MSERKPGSKKHKPSFDVARDPIPETKSGWVYRSEPAEAREPREPFDPRDSREAFEPRERREPRASRAPRFEPSAPPSPASRSWLSTGLYLMALPVTLGMKIMFAPVSWMLGSGTKR